MTARILVVDDIHANVKLLEARLMAEYFEVLTAYNGRDALQLCENGQCDLVLLDVMMPEMDGFEVCRRLKQNPRTTHLPVVMVTALDQPDDRRIGHRPDRLEVVDPLDAQAPRPAVEGCQREPSGDLGPIQRPADNRLAGDHKVSAKVIENPAHGGLLWIEATPRQCQLSTMLQLVWSTPRRTAAHPNWSF